MQKAVMDSQGFSQGLDDNETIELTFSTQIGGDNQTDQGFFYSGAATNGGTTVLPDHNGATAGGSFGGKNFARGFYYEKNQTKAPYSASDGS